MPSTMEVLENKKVKLTITVDKADFSAAIERAYKKHRKTIQIPGFRKGRAPLAVIENFYGKEIFYEDAFEDVFRTSYVSAIEEHSVDDVDRPNVDVVELEKGKDVVYTAEVTVKPDVTLGKYKGKTVKVTENKVTDEAIDQEISKSAEQVARLVDVTDRAAQNGDKVNIDYSGSVDGEKFDGGTAEGHELELGSNTFIPGFEDQVVGMTVGEEKDINVTFPEQYHSEELKGKDAVFAVKVNAIKVKELPEIDDDFAMDVSEFDTLDEYKADIRKKLEETANNAIENETQNKIVEMLVDGAEMDIPQCMVDTQVDYMVREMEYRFSGQGFSLEQYMQITGMDMATFRSQYMEEAKKRVEAQLVMEAVQKAENMEVSDEDIDAELVRMSEENGRDLEELKKTFAGPNAQYMKDSLLSQKTMDFLKENVKVKMVKPEKAE